MNDKLLQMKEMRRAMQPYVLFLYEMVFESQMQNVLEIGVRQCQSTRTILSAIEELNNGGMLTSIDLRDRTERIKSTFPSLLDHWKLVIGDSHDENTRAMVLGRKYDMLLIDGDHSYEGCKKDFEMYAPMVKKGGYILMHDIYNVNETMKDFWPEIEAKEKVGLNYGFAGFGIIKV